MAVNLQYPGADDYEQTGAGSGPVEVKQPVPMTALFKVDHSFTYYGAPQIGQSVETEWKLSEMPTSSFFTRVIENSSVPPNPVNAKTADKLKFIYKLDSSNITRRAALDLIVDYLDDWLNEGDFDKCNLLLLAAEPDRLSESGIVTVLGITKAARHNARMFGREIFYRRAHAAVSQRRHSEEAADQLLNRYL